MSHVFDKFTEFISLFPHLHRVKAIGKTKIYRAHKVVRRCAREFDKVMICFVSLHWLWLANTFEFDQLYCCFFYLIKKIYINFIFHSAANIWQQDGYTIVVVRNQLQSVDQLHGQWRSARGAECGSDSGDRGADHLRPHLRRRPGGQLVGGDRGQVQPADVLHHQPAHHQPGHRRPLVHHLLRALHRLGLCRAAVALRQRLVQGGPVPDRRLCLRQHLHRKSISQINRFLFYKKIITTKHERNVCNNDIDLIN